MFSAMFVLLLKLPDELITSIQDKHLNQAT